MMDTTWLTAEAGRLHVYFSSLFYLLVGALLVFGVFLEYFKFPLGGMPSFAVLVGRACIAIFLLSTYNEVANTIGVLSDQVAADLGNLGTLNNFVNAAGERFNKYSVDLWSTRSLLISAISLLSYLFLMYSVIICEAAHYFCWTILYVTSPVLIAMYILPSTKWQPRLCIPR